MSGKHIFQKNQVMNKDQKIGATDNINFGTITFGGKKRNSRGASTFLVSKVNNNVKGS